jgi:iron-sulfur cluster assembly protein
MNKSKEIITLTEAAKNRVVSIMSNAKESYIGLRIGIDKTGCSGNSYKIEYAKEKKNGDEEISLENIKIFVEPKATMFILGSKMDYVDNGVESGFTFDNPNEKGRCGCGESFHV